MIPPQKPGKGAAWEVWRERVEHTGAGAPTTLPRLSWSGQLGPHGVPPQTPHFPAPTVHDRAPAASQVPPWAQCQTPRQHISPAAPAAQPGRPGQPNSALGVTGQLPSAGSWGEARRRPSPSLSTAAQAPGCSEWALPTHRCPCAVVCQVPEPGEGTAREPVLPRGQGGKGEGDIGAGGRAAGVGSSVSEASGE